MRLPVTPTGFIPHLTCWDQPAKQWGFQSWGLPCFLCLSQSPLFIYLFTFFFFPGFLSPDQGWPGIAVISSSDFSIEQNHFWLIPGYVVLGGFLSPVHFPVKPVGVMVRTVKYFHNLWCFLIYIWNLVVNREAGIRINSSLSNREKSWCKALFSCLQPPDLLIHSHHGFIIPDSWRWTFTALNVSPCFHTRRLDCYSLASSPAGCLCNTFYLHEYRTLACRCFFSWTVCSTVLKRNVIQ